MCIYTLIQSVFFFCLEMNYVYVPEDTYTISSGTYTCLNMKKKK